MCFIKNYIIFFLHRILWKGRVRLSISSIVDLKASFEGANRIGPNSYFVGRLGYGSYLSDNCSIVANIGRFTSIAPHVRSSNGVHPYTYPYVSTSPMFYSTKKQNGLSFANKMLFHELVSMATIGNDCWIGENVFFAGNLVIGDGAVVLAGAVVTKDVPPYAIVGGVPAKVLGYRYNDGDIQYLLAHKWWEKDFDWLKKNWEALCDIEELKKLLSE